MKTIVIYHANCLDGFGAAYAAWYHFKDEAIYHPGYYGKPPPDVTGMDVFMVDFSYSPEIVEGMLKTAYNVTLIDHHKTSLDALDYLQDEGLNFANSTIGEAGCVLAWKYFNEYKSQPWFFEYIRDRDLWLFEKSDTDAMTSYLRTLPFDFKAWKACDDYLFYSDVCHIGNILVTQRRQRVADTVNRCARNVDMFGTIVPLVNASPDIASEVGAALAMAYPFVAVYEDREDGRVFSLRSAKENPEAADVAVLAQKMGGGGHCHASGFRVDRDSRLGRL